MLHARSVIAAGILAACTSAASVSTTASSAASATACANNAEITVPAGFCASIFADSVGRARYATVADNGDVYVSIETTRPNDSAAKIAFVALRDTNNDGRADRIERVPGRGNTGIALHNGFLYVDQGETINRYRRSSSELVPGGPAEAVVTGLPDGVAVAVTLIVIECGRAVVTRVGDEIAVGVDVDRDRVDVVGRQQARTYRG